MAITNKSITNVNIFPTKELYDNNKSSLTDTDLSLVQFDVEGGVIALSLTQNGYIKYDNGLIIQWGWYQESSSASDYKSFPIAFPNKCVSAVVSHMDRVTNQYQSKKAWIEPLTNTQFLIGLANKPDGEETGIRIGMIAIGY